MSVSYYLATLDPVSQDDLQAFAVAQGGTLRDNGSVAFRTANPIGILVLEWSTEARVEYLRRQDRFVNTSRGARASQEAHATLTRVTDALGGPPHDFIELYVHDSPEFQRLAVAFVEAFAKRWSPCVLQTPFTLDVAEEGKNVWTMDEVRKLASKHGRLPTIRNDIPNWFEFFLEKYRREQAEEVS